MRYFRGLVKLLADRVLSLGTVLHLPSPSDRLGLTFLCHPSGDLSSVHPLRLKHLQHQMVPPLLPPLPSLPRNHLDLSPLHSLLPLDQQKHPLRRPRPPRPPHCAWDITEIRRKEPTSSLDLAELKGTLRGQECFVHQEEVWEIAEGWREHTLRGLACVEGGEDSGSAFADEGGRLLSWSRGCSAFVVRRRAWREGR